MSLVSPAFWGFFAVVWAVHWTLRTPRARSALLVCASLTFYASVAPWMALVLLSVALVAYLGALAIEGDRARAGRWVALVVAVDALVLGAFKYFDWIAGSVSEWVGALGVVWTPPDLGWWLPLGLSFYTFQTLGYTIDVSRGDVRARRHLVDYLAFAAVFPPLVAGPIERAGRLLPQLEAHRRLDLAQVRSGLTLAAWGCVTKVVIADTLAPYVAAVEAAADPPGMVSWAAALAFGVQLYADFSGYTNLARGLARTLGLELGINFDRPFLAASTPEFWRRWHISLSTWLRDYLLTPLLGALPGEAVHPARIAGALTVTFVAIGVWHGAGRHFVAFGLWHAAWCLAYLAVAGRVPASLARSPLGQGAAVVFHGLVVLTPGTFFFRGPTLGAALAALQRPPWEGDADAAIVAGAVLALTAAGCALLLAEYTVRRARLAQGLPAQTTAWALAAWAMFVFQPVAARDFLYFRF